MRGIIRSFIEEPVLILALLIAILVIWFAIAANSGKSTAKDNITAETIEFLMTTPTARPPTPTRQPVSCPSRSASCSQLNCAQAYACLRAGNHSLDSDGDGVPCESVCVGG